MLYFLNNMDFITFYLTTIIKKHQEGDKRNIFFLVKSPLLKIKYFKTGHSH